RRTMPDLEPAFDRDLFLLRERFLSISSKYEVWSGDGRPILYVERPTYLLRTVLAYVLAAIAASMVISWTGEAVAAGGSALGTLAGLLGSGLAVATFIVVSLSARPLRSVPVVPDESRPEGLLRVLPEHP